MPRKLRWEELERRSIRSLIRLSLLLRRGPATRKRGLEEAARLARLSMEASRLYIEVVEWRGRKVLRWRG